MESDDGDQKNSTVGSSQFSSTMEVAAIAQETAMADIPQTVSQATNSDDVEYWKAAMLDQITNHKGIFHVFGPPIPREHNMKVTPTRFLFSKKIVSLEERKQNSSSSACVPIPGSSDYERFRARLLYVNNKFTSVQSLWEELLIAPVVDKTSV